MGCDAVRSSLKSPLSISITASAVRLFLAFLLLPLFGTAQTSDTVQAQIDKLLHEGGTQQLVEDTGDHIGHWSKSVIHKTIECGGDQCSQVRYGLINHTTGDTLAADFREIKAFMQYIFLSRDGWASLVDTNLKVIKVYPRAHVLSSDFIAVYDGQHYGVVDTLTNPVIQSRYDTIIQVSDLWAPHHDKTPDFIVRSGDKWGVINYKGGVKINLAYEMLIQLEGFAGFAGKKGKYGFVRWDGAPVTPFVYDSMYTDWSNPNFIVVKDNKLGLMDDDGKELVKPSFSEVTRASTYGCRCVQENGKYAIISSRGINLSGFRYDNFKRYAMAHDEVLLHRNGKWGFFGCRSKKEISPFHYDSVEAFYGHQADVVQHGVKKTIKLNDGH